MVIKPKLRYISRILYPIADLSDCIFFALTDILLQIVRFFFSIAQMKLAHTIPLGCLQNSKYTLSNIVGSNELFTIV